MGDTSIAMLPKRLDVCNWTYYLPGGGKKGEMPCIRDLDARQITTFWVPETDVPLDTEDDFGIHVVYYGLMDRNIEYGFVLDMPHMEGQKHTLEPYPHARGALWGGFRVDEDLAKFFNYDNGYFMLRCNGIPPYPVSIWME